MKRAKSDKYFEPIDLGFDIKFEPLIKTDDTPKTSLSTDIKSMAQDFKKDYDDLNRGLQYMKNDFAPGAKKLIKKIKRTKLVKPFKFKPQFKKTNSYKSDDAYIKS